MCWTIQIFLLGWIGLNFDFCIEYWFSNIFNDKNSSKIWDYGWKKSCTFDVKISNVYHSMGHI
jgi:hypothetical protein